MKVRASAKVRCDKCKIVKRRGVVRVICSNPRHKQSRSDKQSPPRLVKLQQPDGSTELVDYQDEFEKTDSLPWCLQISLANTLFPFITLPNRLTASRNVRQITKLSKDIIWAVEIRAFRYIQIKLISKSRHS